MHTNEWADQANARLASQSDAYRSTTEPLNRINDTLKEIKALLIEIRNLMQDGKSS
jgi:hypothetical protein